MSDLSVKAVMHVGVVSCEPDTAVEEVGAAMREHGISAVIVVDQAGAALGVISKTDLVNAAFVQPYMRYWRGMAARHLMSSPVVFVHQDAPLHEALDLLRSRRIHRLVVTEPGPGGERPVGILSLTDVVRALDGIPVLGRSGEDER